MHNDDKTSLEYEQQLFRRFCLKELKAGLEMENIYGQRLWRYIRRSLVFNDHEGAEDCVQNTWEKLVKDYCGKVLPGSGLWSVLYTVALRQACDAYRKATSKKRSPPKGLLSLHDEEGRETADWLDNADAEMLYQQCNPEEKLLSVEEKLKREERSRRFKQAVAQLSEKQQIALHLKFTQGLSVREIAELMGEKFETVRNHLRLAKEHLKKRLME